MTEEWPTLEVESWARFVELIRELLPEQTHPAKYVFRGQSDASWSLSPSLLRLLPAGTPPDRALAVEARLEKEFQSHAPLVLPEPALERALTHPRVFDRWAFMRHYGVPTRILDWTSSPFVAAYFATADHLDESGAIFVVHPASVHEQAGVALDDRGDLLDADLMTGSRADCVLFFSPDLHTERSAAQQGHFSMNANILGDHDSSILTAVPDIAQGAHGRITAAKIVLGPEIKLEVLAQLRLMNVHPQTLFPGLDGIGRSLQDLVRLGLLRND